MEMKMTTEDRDKAQRVEAAPPPRRPPKTVWIAPRLARWGSLVDLTEGPIFGTTDGDFSSSSGV
jgi:hypothetical protein